ncbi:MAG: phage terminase large subunit [Candidatus Tyrphobacter sp.]
MALSSAQAAAVAEAASAELARRGLLDLARRMHPAFQAPPHLRKLADILERVESGELPRVIIALHPGSGKSTMLQLYAAWTLGRKPERRLIATSAAERLVVRNSRAVRDLFEQSEWPFNARLDENATAAAVWETSAGGGLFATGVGGTITGWRGDIIVCDDLEDGQSSMLELDGLEDWFRSKLLTRLEPGAPIVVVQTRWPNDDLPRRLMNGPRGKEWRYVRMAALAEDDDELGREPGEALWPQRFDVAALEAIREDIGSRHFAAQYQGAPTTDGGNLIRIEWFGRYTQAPQNMTRVVQWLDSAAKTGVRNDYSAIVTMGATDGAFYVLDVVRRRVEYPDLLRMVAAEYEKHSPRAVYAEDTSNAIALIQELSRESHLPIVAVKAVGSKEARAEAITGLLEAGKVYLPTSAPWLADFENELAEFPVGDHDDMADAFVGALSQLRERLRQKPFALRVPQGGF